MGCFLKALGHSDNFIKTVGLKKRVSSSGMQTGSLRGKISPNNKWPESKREEARNHIKSFPAYGSQYTRQQNNSNLYLPSNLNLEKMHDLYKAVSESPVCMKIYAKEFHELKLKLKNTQVDTCSTCDKFNDDQCSSSSEERENIIKLRYLHHTE